jgi:putative transposase
VGSIRGNILEAGRAAT